MTAAAIAALILGFSVTAPLTPLGALSFLAFTSNVAPKIIKLQQQFDTPAVRAWAARNGDAAIRMRPGISTER